MQQLDIGEVAIVDTQWYDQDGDPAEPTAITLTIVAPDGSTQTVVKAAMTGTSSSIDPTLDVWTYLLVVAQAGVWRVLTEGTVGGGLVTQPEKLFLVGVDTGVLGLCEPWCTWAEVEACVPAGLLDGLDSAAREVTLDIASEILFDLDKRKYPGICETRRSICLACRPCWPLWCHCDPRDTIDLALTPVWGVWDVVIDGTTLDPSQYALTRRRFLSRTDNTLWPRSTDVRDPNAFALSWAHGRPVPSGGRRAAALFAAEIAKGCMAMECAIPQRITSIVREGVTYPVLDSLSMIAEGRTGVALTDLWVVADLKGNKVLPGMFSAGAAARVTHG